MIESYNDVRSFQTRYGSRVAIVGGGMLGMTLALRYRQAGRIVTVFEASERVERRGHAAVASRDRSLMTLLNELELASNVRWDALRLQGSRFGALLGGRGQIVESLREFARAIGVDVRLGARVHGISMEGSGFSVDAGVDTGEFDEVVLTVPSPIASQLLPELPDRERLALRGVDYVAIVNVSFVLKARAGQHYISRVVRGRDQFTVLDPGALSSADELRGAVYVTRPLLGNDALLEADDRLVIENFVRALPGNADIVSARVMRMPHAFAHQQHSSFTSSVPGLSIVNAAHMRGGRHHLERTAALAATVFRTLCAERIL